MFIFTKKSITFSCVIVAVIVSLASTCFFMTKQENFCVGTIVIDAGHGGWDGGCVGINGTIEADVTLEIEKKKKKKLKKQNFEIIMTREKDEALGEKKLSDMKERAKIIQEANASAVISIHVNKYSNAQRRGVQVFYDDTNIGKEFAYLMQQGLNVHFNKKYSGKDNLECLPGDYYITKCALVPSIIIECGFLSNQEDEKLLNNKQYKEDLSSCIENTICSIFLHDSV